MDRHDTAELQAQAIYSLRTLPDLLDHIATWGDLSDQERGRIADAHNKIGEVLDLLRVRPDEASIQMNPDHGNRYQVMIGSRWIGEPQGWDGAQGVWRSVVQQS